MYPLDHDRNVEIGISLKPFYIPANSVQSHLSESSLSPLQLNPSGNWPQRSTPHYNIHIT